MALRSTRSARVAPHAAASYRRLVAARSAPRWTPPAGAAPETDGGPTPPGFQPCLCPRPPTTADLIDSQQIRIIHPFHPLYGQSFRFVVSKKLWGE
ncbi:MAG: DUF5372 family protein, partial [Gammaproteobacteria bacterium]